MLLVDLVGLDPLHEHPSVVQATAAGTIEFPREEIGDSTAVRVGRLADDQVVTPGGRQQHFPRVVEDHSHLGVRQDVAIDRAAAAGHFPDRRLQLDDVDVLDRGNFRQPAGRLARSQADDNCGSRLGMQRRRR